MVAARETEANRQKGFAMSADTQKAYAPRTAGRAQLADAAIEQLSLIHI